MAGICHGRHFDKGAKNCLAKIEVVDLQFVEVIFDAPYND